MVNFTKAQIIEFLKSIGFSQEEVAGAGDNFNLFEFLKYEPVTADNGQRKLSPYEILRVPPQIHEGKEKPIVFVIKNKTKKIGKYEGQSLVFFYKSKAEREKSIIEELKEQYRRAMFFGDSERADEILETLTKISSEEALKLKSTYFDYLKHYKKMKKQLLLDVFAHFFLVYLSSQIKSVKRGIIKFDKVYRPYVIDESMNLETDENSFQASFFGTQPQEDSQKIKSVSAHIDDELDENFDFEGQDQDETVNEFDFKPSVNQMGQAQAEANRLANQNNLMQEPKPNDGTLARNPDALAQNQDLEENDESQKKNEVLKSFLKKNVHFSPKHLDENLSLEEPNYLDSENGEEILKGENGEEKLSFLETVQKNIDEKLSLEKD